MEKLKIKSGYKSYQYLSNMLNKHKEIKKLTFNILRIQNSKLKKTTIIAVNRDYTTKRTNINTMLTA